MVNDWPYSLLTVNSSYSMKRIIFLGNSDDQVQYRVNQCLCKALGMLPVGEVVWMSQQVSLMSWMIQMPIINFCNWINILPNKTTITTHWQTSILTPYKMETLSLHLQKPVNQRQLWHFVLASLQLAKLSWKDKTETRHVKEIIVISIINMKV